MDSGLLASLGPGMTAPCYDRRVMKRENFPIDRNYVPTARRATLDPAKVDTLAADILESGLKAPILVRPDGARFVLVEGLHRLEACKALGETSIDGYLVQARRH
jgi:hypothetical protein